MVDLSNGHVIWSYTRADDPTMNYSLPGSAAIVDSDNDGFIDTAYVGDIGGNVWRFKFCPLSLSSTCTTADWSGGVLFQSNGVIKPVYTTPTVTKDQIGNLWIYWGTGDKSNPTDTSSQDNFYAVKDTLRSGSYGSADLEDITSSTYFDAPTKRGWYLNLSTRQEKKY